MILVADIDRGGAFAHLYGTWALQSPEDRDLLRAFVLNKFRGDERLLDPAPAELAAETGMAFAGVLPYLRHALPDEDGAAPSAARPGAPRVAIVRYPTASNLDEFKPLEQVASVAWATRPSDLEGAELVVLPGSKHVAADLEWLRATGLAAAVAGRPAVLGICGGMQMLGLRIDDEGSVDGSADGLGLLQVRTVFHAKKRAVRIETTFGRLDAPWSGLSGLALRGYEIRHGETSPAGDVEAVLPGGRGYAANGVLGISVHGLFEQPELVRALLGSAPSRSLDETFDRLADAVEEHLDVALFARLAGVA